MHWNGRRWKEVDAVNRDDGDLGYETEDEFTNVDAVSPSEAWATHKGIVRGDIQRWDGRRWRIVHVSPAESILTDVAALSLDDVWAVGPLSYTPREARP